MTKITTTTTTTIAYLLIAVAALPPTKAPPPEAALAQVAPPPQLDCLPYLVNAGDCLDFVMNGSTSRKPARECCPELANLTGTHPICLCEFLFNSSQLLNISIDMNKALKLPSLCNISTPQVSSCAGVAIPSPSPGVAIPSPSPSKAPGNEYKASSIIAVLILYIYINLI